MALLKNLCKRLEIRGSAPCHRQACTRRRLPRSLSPAPSQQHHREVQPMGVFRSCFACRNGCPRQGSLVPTSLGRVELNDVSFDGPAGQALKGLEDFSHVWIVWSFHKHRSLNRSARVKPPRLGGDSIGVFSCRSPKRPNPIGMTACKIESINTGEEEGNAKSNNSIKPPSLLVSGIDLLDGTPILDIKPYIPKYDSFGEASVPDWLLEEEEEKQRMKETSTSSIGGGNNHVSVLVEFERDVLEDIETLSKASLLFQGNANTMKKAIQDILTADPRSRISKKHEEQTYSFTLDNVYVTCSLCRQKKTEGEEEQEALVPGGLLLRALVTRVSERLPLTEPTLLDCVRDFNNHGGEEQEKDKNKNKIYSPLGNRVTLQSLMRMFYADPRDVEEMVNQCIGRGLLRKAGEDISISPQN